MPPESNETEQVAHHEQMRDRYGYDLNEAQADAVYGLAYRLGHSNGEREVEIFYDDLADLARGILDKDER